MSFSFCLNKELVSTFVPVFDEMNNLRHRMDGHIFKNADDPPPPSRGHRWAWSLIQGGVRFFKKNSSMIVHPTPPPPPPRMGTFFQILFKMVKNTRVYRGFFRKIRNLHCKNRKNPKKVQKLRNFLENFGKIGFSKRHFREANFSNVTFQKHTKGSPLWSVFRKFSGNFPRGGVYPPLTPPYAQLCARGYPHPSQHVMDRVIYNIDRYLCFFTGALFGAAELTALCEADD